MKGVWGNPQNFQAVSEHRSEQRRLSSQKSLHKTTLMNAQHVPGLRATSLSLPCTTAGTPQTQPGNRMQPPPRTPKWILHHPMSLHHWHLTQGPRGVCLIGTILLLMQSSKLCLPGMGSFWHRPQCCWMCRPALKARGGGDARGC